VIDLVIYAANKATLRTFAVARGLLEDRAPVPPGGCAGVAHG